MQTCPTCNGYLDIQPMFSETETTCTECAYTEPAGSARFTTFLSQVISNFLKASGVVNIGLNGEKVELLSQAMDGTFLLPAVLINAKLNCSSIGSVVSDFPLTLIDDGSAFYGRRVITTHSNISNPSMCLTALVHTLEMAWNESLKNPENKSTKTLDVSNLQPISGTNHNGLLAYADELSSGVKVSLTKEEQLYV